MSYYTDGAEWCILINRHISDWLVKMLKKDLSYNIQFWCPLHIEPYARYRQSPPENKDWRLYKKGVSETEAFQFCQTDEYVSILKEILLENGIQVASKRQETISDGRQHGQSWRSVRFNVMKRDGYKCQICGKTAQDGVKLEVDHKKALANGGKNTPDNLWTLCFDCNRGKKVKDL